MSLSGLLLAFIGLIQYCESKDIFDVVYNLAETPLEGCCYVFVLEDSSSLDCDNVLHNTLGHSHVFLMCSQPSSSLEYYSNAPINNPMICDIIID